MKIRRITKAFALPAAIGIIMTSGSPAQAHYVYQADQAWSNADSSFCLWNYSETSHGSTGGGYFKGEARSQADIDANPLDCVLTYRRNIGDLADFITVYKWYVDSQGAGSWIVCDKMDNWIFNQEQASTLRVTWTAPAGGLCGAGYYGIHNSVAMRESGVWVGREAYVWSGQHLLPDNTFGPSVERKAPDAPAWFTDKGLGKIPAELPKAGSDGKPLKDRNGNQVMVDPSPPELNEREAATGGTRSTSVDEYGNVIETVSIISS